MNMVKGKWLPLLGFQLDIVSAYNFVNTGIFRYFKLETQAVE